MTTCNELGHLLNKASRLTKLRVNTKLNGFNLTFPQYVLIKHIYQRELALNEIESEEEKKKMLLTPASIAEELGYVRAAITGIIDRLIKLGFVNREINPYDRRSLLISLTEKAREIIVDVDNFLEDTSRNILEGFEQSEVEEMAVYLQRIIDNLGEYKDLRDDDFLEEDDL